MLLDDPGEDILLQTYTQVKSFSTIYLFLVCAHIMLCCLAVLRLVFSKPHLYNFVTSKEGINFSIFFLHLFVCQSVCLLLPKIFQEYQWYVSNFLLSFKMIVILPLNSLFTFVHQQVTPVPPDFVRQARSATPEDYPYKDSGFAVTIGQIASQSLQVMLHSFLPSSSCSI